MFPHIQNRNSSEISVKASQYHAAVMSGDNRSAASSLKQEASPNQSNIPKPCSHPDVMCFRDGKCCLSCGETIASLDQSSLTYSESSSEGDDEDDDEDDNEDDNDDDDSVPSVLDDQADHVTVVSIFQPQGYNEKFFRRKGSYGFRALQHDKKEIRLVLLEPGKPSEQVACSIFHTILGSWNQSSYEAVSYTWADEKGDYSFSQTLYCGNEEVPVTKNCESALKKLRHETQRRKIWIDQLCIDQSDIAERGHQVGLMSEIYAKADQVLIYLGQNICLVQDLLQYILGTTPAYLYNIRESLRRHDWQSDILRAVSSSWFTRVWVLQEIACARKAFLLTSDALVPWERFKSCIERFRTIDPNGPIKSLPGPLNFDLRHVATTDQLLDLLVSTNSCNAGDSRDKVFALYGTLIGAAHDGLIADYNKSPEQVFLETAYRIVGNVAGLRILSYATGGEDSTLHLPSWVPDWGTRRRRSLAEEFESELLRPQSQIKEYEFVSARQARNPTFPITFKQRYRLVNDKNMRQLELRGFCLDIVTDIGCYGIPNGMYCSLCRNKYLILLRWAADKRYYTFGTKKLVGFSTNQVEPGDKIWHFDDTARAYFICRDLEGCTILVGDCFLCGFSYPQHCYGCRTIGRDSCDVYREYMTSKVTKVAIS